MRFVSSYYVGDFKLLGSRLFFFLGMVAQSCPNSS